MKRKAGIYLIVVLLLCSRSGWAKVVPAGCFTDNMVLQQQAKANVWGIAKAGAQFVIVPSWDKHKYYVRVAANGHWSTKISTPAYGGPYEISFDDGEILTLHNVLIGDVWVCSGQSNMEMPVTSAYGAVLNAPQEIANAKNYDQIRMMKVDNKLSFTPQTELPVKWGWRVCNPENVGDFSAVAYFFAKKVYEVKHIPIGLINDNWGGTVAEAWTSGSALKTMPEFAEFVKATENGLTQAGLDKRYQQEVRNWIVESNTNDPGYKNGVAQWAQLNFDDSSWPKMQLPVYWQQAGVAGYNGTMWFRKVVDVPAAWAGKDLKLNMAGVDDYDDSFFNGEEVGHTELFIYPRNYTIPGKLVKAGKNVIAVRVFDNGGLGGINKGPLTLQLAADANTRLDLAGNWAYQKATPLAQLKQPPLQPNTANRPTLIYNAMINPLLPFTIKGVIWYQGESNADRAYQYRTLFPLLIKDWRAKWGQGNFPFYFVQLANYGAADQGPAADWPGLRFAQLNTLKVPNTGMAVAIDIGENGNIHPKNKQEVGRRLALAALAQTYGENIPYSGPLYRSQQINGNEVIISFNHADKGLISKGEELRGFTIAGADKHFYEAQARIKGDNIVLSSPQVQSPVAVRYDWQNDPNGNLYNGADLPASPFKTDNWDNK